MAPLAGAMLFGQLSAQTYDYTCYCATTRSTPDSIVRLDNNEQLLQALAQPQTLDQLKAAGLGFNQSQIQLLLDWRLLKEDGDLYQTAFPLLDPGKTEDLRGRMRRSAEAAETEFAGAVRDVRKILAGRGREKNLYTVLFSYVLDNLVWSEWEDGNVLKPLENTLDDPVWAGTFWATSPKRTFFCGTNSLSDKGYSLKVNWAEKAIPLMAPFVTDWKNQEKLFTEITTQGMVTDPEAKAVFAPFRLFDEAGVPTIPLIVENPDDALYRACRDLGRAVGVRVLNEVKSGALKDLLTGDDAQLLVIAYHEWMWEFLDACERKGLIEKPVAFAHPESATSADIGDLVFLVKQGLSAPQNG